MALQFCLFKELTGVPCPGCGCTRAFLCLLRGEVGQALWYNPLVIVLIIFALVLLVATLVETCVFRRPPSHEASLYSRLFRRRLPSWVIVVAALLTAANWAWNIAKGL